MEIVLQILINALISASIYALVASGVSFLYATTKIFHLAHGGVVMAGGYTFWWLWRAHGVHPILAVIGSIVLSALVAYCMNEFVYEPLRRRGAKGLGYLIATLALLMFSVGGLLALFGAQPRTFGVETRIFEFSGVSITAFQLGIIGVAAGLLAGLFLIMKYTKFGKAMRATADNETVAEVLGIDTRLVRRIAFLLSGVLGAAAGIVQGVELSLDPNRAVVLAVFGFASAVVGGVGTLSGVMVGSTLIGLTEQLVVWFFGGLWRNAIVFGLLFVFLLVRPAGIFGRKQ